MLHLAAFSFLQSAVYLVMGSDRPYPFFPSISREESILNPVSEPSFWFGTNDTTSPFLKNPSVSSQPTELSLSNWSSKKCIKVPSMIETFSNIFVEKVKSCDELEDAFQLRGFNEKSARSIFYNYTFNAISSVGGLDAPLSAKILSDAVATNLDKLERDLLIRIYGDSVGSYLFYRGYLSPSNVASLAEEYFKSNERAMKDIKHPCKEENLLAIGKALVNFLSSLGLFNQYSTTMITGFLLIPLNEL